MRDQRGKFGNVFSDSGHESIGEGLILKTFVHVVEKAATKQWVMEKLMAGAGRHFERILNGLDLFKGEVLKPSSSFLCRWPFVQVCLESTSLGDQPLLDHCLIHRLP